MMRALRGLMRVKRALALLTMVVSSGRPSYPRASSLCSRHGPLRTPKKFEKNAEESALLAYPARRDRYFTRRDALCKSEAAEGCLQRLLLRTGCGLGGCSRSAARRDLSLPVAGVAVEGARRRELAELVPHHVLRDEDRDELPAVVHGEGQP